jgi:hypothetical protein
MRMAPKFTEQPRSRDPKNKTTMARPIQCLVLRFLVVAYTVKGCS